MRHVLKYIIILFIIIVIGLITILIVNRGEYMEKVLDKSAEMGFDVQEIDLYGRENTTIESIENIINPQRGYPIFAIDVDEVKEKLLNLAWVKDVSVRRQLPDKMVIDIVEHKPLAIWQNNEKYFIISDEGKVLRVGVERFTDLPIVVGENSPIGTPLLLSYIESHFPEIRSRIKSITREGDRRWSVMLDDLKNGIEIKLPENQPNVALEELANLHKENDLLEKNVSRIDMRVPDKIMIKFQTNNIKKYKRQDS